MKSGSDAVLMTHGVKGYTMAIALILFILLVIITSMSGLTPYEDGFINGNSSGIESASTFRVFNQTNTYTLELESFQNIQNPSVRRVPAGGSQALILEGTTGNVNYGALNSNNLRVGSFNASLSSNSGFSIIQYSGQIYPFVTAVNRYNIVVRYL